MTYYDQHGDTASPVKKATTTRERVLAALRGERVRPVPVGAVTQTATVSQMRKLGQWWPDAHFDAESLASLAAGAVTLLGFDLAHVPFDQTIEAESLGAEIDHGGKGTNPSVKSNPHSVDGSLPPFPSLNTGRPQAVVSAVALLRKRLGEDAAVIGGAVGPFTLVSQLVGLTEVLTESLLNPEKIRPYYDLAVRVGAEYARRQAEAGADAICVEDMAASLDLTSPGLYQTVILPAQQQLVAAIDVPVVLHVCGGNTRILDLLTRTGAEALSLEAKTDLAEAVTRGACVVGGVPPMEVLLREGVDEVCRSTLESLGAGVHVVAPGCAIPLRTPDENLLEMARVARSWEE